MRPAAPGVLAALLSLAPPAWAADVEPGAGQTAPAGDAGRVDFGRDVRPILSDRCFACHGPDGAARSSPLRFDSEEGAHVALDSGGFAFVAGDPGASVLLDRVTADPGDWSRMPPAEAGEPLTPEQIDVLRRWIEQGAEWGNHWSFEPVVKPAVPKIPAASPIDAFLDRRLEQAGIAVNGPAPKTELIRRATFSLTGLPPTPEEVDAFLADESPDAYGRVVDRLLASPHYGEHRARYWLDAARYGDTHGLHLDNRREIWPYRDWVVRAFNQNEPFDEFTVEQLAGDLLPNPSLDQLVATGFNRCNVTTSEGGSIDEEYRVRYAVDRTETVGTVFMGLTVGCAACHDHKFDPVSQKEFYSLYAYYRSTQDAPMDGNALLPPPAVLVETPWQTAERGRLQDAIAAEEHAFRSYVAGLDYPAPAAVGPAGDGAAGGKTAGRIDGSLAHHADHVDQPAADGTADERGDWVWVDDAAPPSAEISGDETAGGIDGWKWTTREAGPVFSGSVAWQKTSRYQVQSLFKGAESPVVAGAGDTLFVHVYIEEGGNPGSIMLQAHTPAEGWDHRAVWGNKNGIEYGTLGTPSRVHQGELPGRGEWTRLEVPLAEIGIDPGETIDGLAFTQKGGILYWDAAGFATDRAGELERAAAQAAWERAVADAGLADALPGDLPALLAVPPAERDDAAAGAVAAYYRRAVHPQLKARFASHRAETESLRAALSRLNGSIPSSLVMKEEAEPRPAFVLNRGQYDDPGEPVAPAVPAVLPPLPEDAPKNRLALARWLVDPDHPLTARVTVNRFWQQHFGTGLVKTSEDFGSQGEQPSHPELLDYLAAEFVESGWDVKALHRRIVTSAAFRRSAAAAPAQLDADAENRLLARGPRYRLDAESIRDAALAASGLLTEKLGGPGVKPYQPEGIWEAVAFVGSDTQLFRRDEGDALHRRSVYTFWKRTAPPPGLATLDAPTRESCVVRRGRTNTPLQALLLMNDEQFVEAARHLGARMLTEGGAADDSRLTRGFRLALGRAPGPDELAVLRQTLNANREQFRADPAAANALLRYGETPPAGGLDPAEHAAYTLVGSLLMNTDAFITKG